MVMFTACADRKEYEPVQPTRRWTSGRALQGRTRINIFLKNWTAIKSAIRIETINRAIKTLSFFLPSIKSSKAPIIMGILKFPKSVIKGISQSKKVF